MRPVAEERQVKNHSFAIPPVVHQVAAELRQNNTKDSFSSAKSKTPTKNDPISLFHHFGSKPNTHHQSLFTTTEFLNEFKPGDLEDSPSEESDALREAFQSLGLGEDLHEKCEHLEVALQQTQAQLEAMAQENALLKLQFREDAEQQQNEQNGTMQRSSKEKVL